MKKRAYAVAILAFAASFAPAPAAADEAYRHGYIRHVEPGVTLQRATEVSAEEAVVNLPFLPGDRVWTDAGGRVEFRFTDGSAVRLDRRSKLDYAAHDERDDETIVLRLWSGSLILRSRSGQMATFEIETPSGLVRLSTRGVFRVDVEQGETWLLAYEGRAMLDTGQDRVEVSAGERAGARWGGPAFGPEPFDRYAGDDFARWDEELEAREAWAASGRRYLPTELAPYAVELDTYGTWAYEPAAGYVWRPRVAVGWTPYSNGYWAWTPFWGYSWVAYEPWGWAPFHYGRWGFSISLGWYWWPDRVWGPGWVSWWVGNGYVGWCPLGRHGRSVVPWSRHRGHAVPRGSIGHADGWSVVRHGDLGRRDLARRRVSPDPDRLEGVRIAEEGRERPTRNGLSLTRTRAVPRSAISRPRPTASTRPLPTSPRSPGTSVGRSRGAPDEARSPGGSGGAVRRTTPRSEDSRRLPDVGASRPRPRAGDESPRRVEPPRSREGRPFGGVFRRDGDRREDEASRARPRSSGVGTRGRTGGAVSPSPARDRGASPSRPRSYTPRSDAGTRGRTGGAVSPSPARDRGASPSRPRSYTPRSDAGTRGRTGGAVSPSPARDRGVSPSRPRSSSPRTSVGSRDRSSSRSGSGPRASGSSSRPSRPAPRVSAPHSSAPRSTSARSQDRGSSAARSRNRPREK